MKPMRYPTEEDATEACRYCGGICEEPDGVCLSCWEDMAESIREDESRDDLLLECREG